MRKLISFIQSLETEGLRPLTLQAGVRQGFHSELVVGVGSKILHQEEFLRDSRGHQVFILNKLIADRADVSRQFGRGQPSDNGRVSVNLSGVGGDDGGGRWRGRGGGGDCLTDGYHCNNIFKIYN